MLPVRPATHKLYPTCGSSRRLTPQAGESGADTLHDLRRLCAALLLLQPPPRTHPGSSRICQRRDNVPHLFARLAENGAHAARAMERALLVSSSFPQPVFMVLYGFEARRNVAFVALLLP